MHLFEFSFGYSLLSSLTVVIAIFMKIFLAVIIIRGYPEVFFLKRNLVKIQNCRAAVTLQLILIMTLPYGGKSQSLKGVRILAPVSVNCSRVMNKG